MGVRSMGLRKLLYAANDKVGHEPNDDQRPGGRYVGPDPGFEACPAVQAGPGLVSEPLEEPSAKPCISMRLQSHKNQRSEAQKPSHEKQLRQTDPQAPGRSVQKGRRDGAAKQTCSKCLTCAVQAIHCASYAYLAASQRKPFEGSPMTGRSAMKKAAEAESQEIGDQVPAHV